MRLRANQKILQRLKKALRAARLTDCGIEFADQDAYDQLRIYLETWVAGPIEEAIAAMQIPSRPRR